MAATAALVTDPATRASRGLHVYPCSAGGEFGARVLGLQGIKFARPGISRRRGLRRLRAVAGPGVVSPRRPVGHARLLIESPRAAHCAVIAGAPLRARVERRVRRDDVLGHP
jgi:hypothetical protein